MDTKGYIAALAAALLLAGCGSAASSSDKAEDVSAAAVTQPAESAASEAESVSEADGTAGESEPEASEPEADESEEEVISAEESTPEDAATDYEALLASISDGHKFESFAETVTFSELNAQGLANVIGEGKAYALTYASGGAGSLMYDLWYTADGGESWEKGEGVSFFNGQTSRFALEDGRLAALIHISSDFEDVPKAYAISCSEDFKLTVTEIEDWFASPSIPKDKPFNAYAEYKGDYVLRLTLKAQTDESESEEAFFSEDITLDPLTLAPLTGEQ